MTKKDLENIFKIESTHNIDDNIDFDYFRIAKYNEDVDLKDKKNILFFPVHVDESELSEGWYISSFDLRSKIADIVKNNPRYYYIIEKNMVDQMPDNSKYIVVDSINDSIRSLFNYSLDAFKGKIVCVTGSVGKTTTVGFIKQVLGDKALRIYSKRITPLVLENFVINYLNNNYDYLVLEASLWYKKHMTYFSNTLKPDLAVMLDIYKEHIGVDDIKDVSDITKYKSFLLEKAKNVIINNMDSELKKINIKDNYVYYNDEKVVPTDVKKVIKVNDYNKEIVPYIKTRLTLLEQTIAYEVAKFYKLDKDTIINRLNNSTTVENRLVKTRLYDHDIIFDGDVSGVARFKTFSDHYYDKSCLVICNLTENGEENEPYELLNNYLDNFNYVYVNQKLKKYFNNDKIKYFDNLDFIKDLDKDYQIFMHYGSYYRLYSELSSKELEGKKR